MKPCLYYMWYSSHMCTQTSELNMHSYTSDWVTRGFVSTRKITLISPSDTNVREIADMLSQHVLLVKVMSFMGQASSGKATRGQTQKEQLEASHSAHS